jgi:hypothetical protein
VSTAKTAEFAPLEKTAQQLREEEIEQRMKDKPAEVIKGKGGWLGSKQEPNKAPVAEFKVSGWATKAESETSAPVKFAPL